MPLKVQHMEKSRMILIFQYLCFLRILSFFPAHFSVESRSDSPAQAFSAAGVGCKMKKDTLGEALHGCAIDYSIFSTHLYKARISNVCHRTFRMESRPGCFRYFAAFFSRATKVLEVWKFAFDSSAFNLLCAF